MHDHNTTCYRIHVNGSTSVLLVTDCDVKIVKPYVAMLRHQKVKVGTLTRGNDSADAVHALKPCRRAVLYADVHVGRGGSDSWAQAQSHRKWFLVISERAYEHSTVVLFVILQQEQSHYRPGNQ